MKNKWISVAVLTVAVVFIGSAAFRWEARYAGRNPVMIEKAKAAIDRGRGYEVLEENQEYLTDDDKVSDLLYFLERQYGLQMSAFEDETVVLTGDHGTMTFERIEIVSFGKRYYIWEREN